MESSYSERKFCSSTPSTRFGDATRFELTLVSVNDHLDCKRRIGRSTRVFAEVQLDGGAITKTDTCLAESALNFPVEYPITKDTGGNLVVRLYHKRTFRNDSIGEANINVSALFREWCDSRQNSNKTVPLLPKGNLNIEYSFELDGSQKVE